MITMMFGGPPSGFDPASSESACRESARRESDSAEATLAFAIMAAVISRRGKNGGFMSVKWGGFEEMIAVRHKKTSGGASTCRIFLELITDPAEPRSLAASLSLHRLNPGNHLSKLLQGQFICEVWPHQR